MTWAENIKHAKWSINIDKGCKKRQLKREALQKK